MKPLASIGLLLARTMGTGTQKHHGSVSVQNCTPELLYKIKQAGAFASCQSRPVQAIVEKARNSLAIDAVEDSTFIYASQATDGLVKQSALLAKESMPLLICGESGTGKSQLVRHIIKQAGVAGKIHELTCSMLHPKVVENICKNLLRADAKRGPGGHTAVIVLKEVQALPSSLQNLLLQTVQARIMPRGRGQGTGRDLLLIASMNLSSKKSFPEQGVSHGLAAAFGLGCINLPPLRERREDILPLSDFFLQKYKCLSGGVSSNISRKACETLLAHSWPGNVRMLENVLLRSLVMQERKEELRTLFFCDPE